MAILLGGQIGVFLGWKSVTMEYQNISYMWPQLRDRHYTPAFYKLADDIDILLARQEDTGWSNWQTCSIPNIDWPLRSIQPKFIMIYEPDDERQEIWPLVDMCFPHELGHIIDRRRTSGLISESVEFQQAVEQSLAMLDSPGASQSTWKAYWLREVIAKFPGINGNPLNEHEWGGYGELYAELFRVGNLDHLPPPLRSFYVGWMDYSWSSVP